MAIQGENHWIWTIQLSRWRYARALGIPIFDITVKSGIKEFAPEWDALMAYKHKEIDFNEYTKLYHEKLIGNLSFSLPEWEKFLNQPNIALACYCNAGAFCHRYLFANLLSTYLQQRGRSVLFQGELIPHPNNAHLFYKQNDNAKN